MIVYHVTGIKKKKNTFLIISYTDRPVYNPRLEVLSLKFICSEDHQTKGNSIRLPMSSKYRLYCVTLRFIVFKNEVFRFAYSKGTPTLSRHHEAAGPIITCICQPIANERVF